MQHRYPTRADSCDRYRAPAWAPPIARPRTVGPLGTTILPAQLHRLFVNRILVERPRDPLPPRFGTCQLLNLFAQCFHFLFEVRHPTLDFNIAHSDSPCPRRVRAFIAAASRCRCCTVPAIVLTRLNTVYPSDLFERGASTNCQPSDG